MSQEHDPKSADTQVSSGIHPEPAPFEPGYQPETLPKISVPDLADDAEGLSAEALANVPTLTELVETETESAPAPAPVVTTVEEPVGQSETTDDLPESSEEPEALAQDEPPQADTWGEQLQVRMGKLTGDIHSLNARLDRLEERNKAKD
jgi:hypothetical protein